MSHVLFIGEEQEELREEVEANGFDADNLAEGDNLNGYDHEAYTKLKEVEDIIESHYYEYAISEWGFEDYARDLAEDIGAISYELHNNWPLYCIDWERAARDLKMDYTSFTFDGQEWLVR
jgi:antirestriction protein